MDPVEIGVDPVTQSTGDKPSTPATTVTLNIPSETEYRQLMAQSDQVEVPIIFLPKAETDKSEAVDYGNGLALPTPTKTEAKAPETLSMPTAQSTKSIDHISSHYPPSTIGRAKLKSRPKKPALAPRLAVAPIVPCVTSSDV